MNPNDVDVVILCGGLGTRLRSVTGEAPKPMVRIGKRPLLEIVIEWIARFGFKRFVLAIGYQGKMIETYFKEYPFRDKTVQILFSYEEKPLGTAGALKHCEHLLRTKAFIVLNGDSYCALDYGALLRFHEASRGVASLVVVEPDPDRRDGGYVELGERNRIISFCEKTPKPDCYLSAGFYVFDHSVLNLIQPKSFSSLENDIFPKLTADLLFGYVTPETLYDIGTPERLERFKRFYLEAKP